MNRKIFVLGLLLTTQLILADEARTINPGQSTTVKANEEVTVTCTNHAVSTFCRCVQTDRLGRAASLVLSSLLADGTTKDVQILGTFRSSGIDPLDPALVTAIQQCQRAAQRTPACFR